MISSRDIITVLTNPNTAVNRGRTMYLLDQAQRSGANPAITDLLSRLTARPVEAQTSHQHPANATKPRDEAPLTPADLMWLDRLPRNPEDVSHRDAIQLATLAQSVGPIKHPADARLVASVWEPVKLVHDRKTAEAAMRNAQQAAQPMPDAYSALYAVLSAEFPGLSEDALQTEASSRLHQAQAQRDAARQSTLADAQAQVDEVTTAATQYQAIDA